MLLYLLRAIRDLVNKFSLFFLPVYLFTLGAESIFYNSWHLTQLQAGMLVIVSYHLVNKGVMLATTIMGGKYTRIIGFTNSMVVSSLIRAVAFMVLYYSFSNPWLIILAAALEGLQSNFFWNTFFTVLTKHTPKNKMGANLGLLQFLLQLIAVLSPLLSGLIIVSFGFDTLFLTGLLLSLLSIILILMMNRREVYDRVSWKEFWHWMRERSYKKLSMAFFGKYINDSVLYIWPLYVFLILGSVEEVGFLYSLSLFLAMIMTFFIGMYLDRSKSKKPFMISGGVLSLIWLARTQVAMIWQIALVDSLERFFANFHWMYFDMIAFRRGKGSQAFSYFVYRELVMSAGGILFWLFLGTYFLFFSNLVGIFVVGSIGALLSTLVSEEYLPDVS